MRHHLLRFLFGISLALALTTGCSFSEPQNGTIVCAPDGKRCPEGYSCVARTNTCWKGGLDLGSDSGVPSPIDVASLPDLPLGEAMSPIDGPQGVETGPTPDGGGPRLDAAPTDSKDVATPDAAPDQAIPDGPAPDAPITDTPQACLSPKLLCDGVCLEAGSCCVASDCTGSCMTCGVDHKCAALKGQDDPTNRCTGTCDTTGTCKAKRGQACTSTAVCISGSTCADGYCCDKACSGTCEACDVAGSLGTCTTLAAGGTPRAGRTACSGTGTCVGACGGSSADCAFPTSTCGTASCSTAGFQAAGKCNLGTCASPTVQACTNACVLPDGCTGICAPGSKGCSAGSSGGVPQLCSTTGAWVDQAACQTLFACVAGTCTCSAPNTLCGTTCANMDTDAKNCGACGHDCLGGSCVGGMCQPVAMTSTFGTAVRLFGMDGTNVYYTLPSATVNNTYDAFRLAKTANNSTGTVVYTSTQAISGVAAIIGSTLFLYDPVGGMHSYTIGVSSAWGPTGVADYGIPFFDVKSVLPRYYAQNLTDTSTTFKVTWYNPTNNAVMGSYSESTVGIAPTGGYLSYTDMAIGGDTIYWGRCVNDSTSSTDASGFYSVNLGSSTRTQVIGGTIACQLRIMDINEKSIVFADYDGYAYRTTLPSGAGNSWPQSVASLGISGLIVEDAKGAYFINSDSGNLYRCSAGNCGPTTVTLVTGVGTPTALLQDANALYWTAESPNRVYKLAK